MKPPITTAQAMQHPDVVTTINTLGQMADELRTRLAEVEKDAARFQWLRKMHDSTDAVTLWHVRGTGGQPIASGELDAAIDAAMEQA